MKLTKKFLLCASVLLIILSCLTGCSLFSEDLSDIEELYLVLTEEDFHQLEEFTGLKKLDLSGTTCYDEILSYIERHPEVDVTYSVYLGSTDYASTTSELTLEAEDFDYDELMENLKFLPSVTRLSLPGTALTVEQIAGITAAYPNIALDYSAELMGNFYDPAATELDLSELTSADVDEAISQLQLFPSVTHVELMDQRGRSELTLSDVKKLQEALPHITFQYTFNLFGKTLSTTDETVEYYDTDIGDSGADEIREALDILTNCTYFKLDDCGISSEVMASIRDDYPNVKIVWRIHIDYFSICTDETMLRMGVILTDENTEELKYCTDITHMDISRNSKLYDISFLEYMPNLECLIMSSSPTTDISPIAGHEKLVWLELAHCGQLVDVSPLKSCTNLKYLNLAYTDAEELSDLDQLPLESFMGMHAKVGTAEQKAFEAAHPDCLIRFEGEQAYGYGWRYADNGITYSEYYDQLREIFHYDDESYYGNRKNA